MDSNTQDRKSGLPSRGTQDELEEALKWLEELTNRKGSSPEPSTPVPSATIDSPFRGLIEDDEGDLPDWLREVPSTPNLEGVSEEEPESRLDWLARMAQRESIEELPTLEWRRIGEPMQSALLPPGREELAAGVDSIAPQEIDAAEPLPEPDPDAVEPQPGASLSWLEPISDEVSIPDLAGFKLPGEPDDAELRALTVEFEPNDELPSADDLDAAMAWIEELAASQDAPIEDIPSVVDRALASKLLMETGASQSVSPLDELGSDSDMLGDTPIHPFIEEEDLADTVVLVETMAADQGMAVEMIDMPVEVPLDEPVEIVGELDEREEAAGSSEPEAAVITEPEEREAVLESAADEEPTAFTEAPADALSFEEAMAYLDGMAAEQKLELSPADEFDSISQLTAQADQLAAEDIAPFPEVESLAANELESSAKFDAEVAEFPPSAEVEVEDVEYPESDFAPWVEDVEVPDMDQPEADTLINEAPPPIDEPEASSLEDALLALDAIALPAGQTLVDIDGSLQTAQVAPQRDVESALDWLESLLTSEQSQAAAPAEQLDDADLIAQMPEDPDAILAWLEQMADEEAAGLGQRTAELEDDSATYVSGGHVAEPLAEELAAADLLSMPDDPDEAMAWLEGLARGEASSREREAADIGTETDVVEADEDATETIEAALEEIEAVTGDVEAELVETEMEEIEPITTEVEVDLIGATLEEVESEAGEGKINLIETELEEVESEAGEVETDRIGTAPVDIEAEAADAISIVEDVAAEVAATADETIIVAESELEETETEPATPDVLSIDAQDIEALEAEAMARGAISAAEGAVEPGMEDALAAVEPIEAQPEPPKPKRQRAKSAKTKVEEAIVEQPPQVSERPELSWVDLLKPLD